MDLDSSCDNQEKQIQPWSSTKGFKAEAEMELKLAPRAAGASGLCARGQKRVSPRAAPCCAPWALRGAARGLRAPRCGQRGAAQAAQGRDRPLSAPAPPSPHVDPTVATQRPALASFLTEEDGASACATFSGSTAHSSTRTSAVLSTPVSPKLQYRYFTTHLPLGPLS